MISDEQIRFMRMPVEYWEPASERGMVRRFVYRGVSLDDPSVKTPKAAYIYLPPGYDKNKKYDILYYIHGVGSPVETLLCDAYETDFRNVLDNLISHEDIAPMIVVTPTFYQMEHSIDSPVPICHRLADMLADELYTTIMPQVESSYRTYAESLDDKGFKDSRKHRAIGGFSMGGVVTWYAFHRYLDFFSVFLPHSGDSWLHGTHSGSNQCEADAKELGNAVHKFGYKPEDFSIYMATGTLDSAYPHLMVQAEAMKAVSDIFKYSDTFGNGNFYFNVAFNGLHWYDFAYEYLYNSLPKYFPSQKSDK